MSKEAFMTPDDWSHAGDTGPEHWHEIAPICANGRQQSPINLDEFTPSDLPPLRFHYDVRALRLAHDGHNVLVFFEDGGSVEAGTERFALDHLHFHAPGEHRIEGRSYALEAHFVHKNAAGTFAVVALLYEDGPFNPTFAKMGDRLPGGVQETCEPDKPFTAADFLPPAHEYYFYSGSRTMPPCTEGVAWHILKSTATIAAGQVEAVLRAHDGPNSRPLQSRNGRKVLSQGDSD